MILGTRSRTGYKKNSERWGEGALNQLNLVIKSANGYFTSCYHSPCLLRNHNLGELALSPAQCGRFEKTMNRVTGERSLPCQPADHLDRANNY